MRTPPRHHFDAVIFDLDGTLLDTEAVAMRAGILAFQSLGIAAEPQFMHRLVGRDQASGLAIIRAEFGDIDTDRLGSEWQAHGRALRERDGVPLKPGATQLLSHLAARGLPLALATSSEHDSAHDKLHRSGLAPYFGAVVTRACVTQPKPAPEAFLTAARLLDTPPARCLAFEDSDTGAQAAHAAGMRVVQIPDLAPTRGRHAHHVAGTLLDGARAAGIFRD